MIKITLLSIALLCCGLWAQPGLARAAEERAVTAALTQVGGAAAAQAEPTPTTVPTPAPLVQEPTRQIPLGVSSLIGLGFLALAAWLNRRAKRDK